MKEITIVLPCYNPIQTWVEQLLLFHREIENKYLINYFIVNDGSVSSTLPNEIDQLRSLVSNVNFISYEKNMGKGYALRKGVTESATEITVYTDIDFPFENKSMIALIEQLADGADVAIGYREQVYYKNVPLLRKLISRIFRFFIKRILRMKITDTQCGLKGFNRKGRDLFLKTTINRYLFDFEFIYRISKSRHVSIKTVAVVLKDGIIFRKMPLSTLFSEGLNLLKIILRKHR